MRPPENSHHERIYILQSYAFGGLALVAVSPIVADVVSGGLGILMFAGGVFAIVFSLRSM